jgi:hypothetical protein
VRFPFLVNFRIARYILANLAFSTPSNKGVMGPPLEILFVTAGKDAEILKFAIDGAIRSSGCHDVTSITVVCPRKDLEIIRKNVERTDFNIRYLAEDRIIPDALSQRILTVFGSRSGWVIQQIIKLEYVKNSKSLGVLVIDADTVLLHSRCWLDFEGTQVLMPTWERHKPYLEFLKLHGYRIAEGSLSHISHHMLFQPVLMKTMLSSYGIFELESLVSLVTQSHYSEHSPFSLDYEMYAQYLLHEHPSRVRYEKWSNFSVEEFSLSECGFVSEYEGFFASVSVHSYNRLKSESS